MASCGLVGGHSLGSGFQILETFQVSFKFLGKLDHGPAKGGQYEIIMKGFWTCV